MSTFICKTFARDVDMSIHHDLIKAHLLTLSVPSDSVGELSGFCSTTELSRFVRLSICSCLGPLAR